MQFAYPDDLNPAWNPRFPEFAFAANSISLLMPYAEPYFVSSVRKALPEIDGPLAVQTRAYLRQETQHQRQHRHFNDIIDRRYPAVLRLERRIQRTYGWFARTRSVRFNLAFAAGSETIAYALARWTEKHLDSLFDGADPVASTLYLWHLAEEVEHKSAAFDVFEAVDGSRLRYLTAMTISFALLVIFTTLGTLTMLWGRPGERRLFSPVAWFRLVRWSVSLAFELLPDMAVSSLPRHHPSDFTDPVWLSTWLRHFDPDSGTMPVWTPGRIS